MQYSLEWEKTKNGNLITTLVTNNISNEIEKHITDADEKGPWYSIKSYQTNTKQLMAVNVTFGNTEHELYQTLDKIISSAKEDTSN